VNIDVSRFEEREGYMYICIHVCTYICIYAYICIYIDVDSSPALATPSLATCSRKNKQRCIPISREREAGGGGIFQLNICVQIYICTYICIYA